VGPVPGKSLFCLHAEKLLALRKQYRAAIPLVVSTNDDDHDGTVDFFQSNNFFGLSRQDVRFLRQVSLPVINRRGLFLLSDRGSVALSSTAHGEALVQLLKEEHFKQLDLRAVEHLFCFQAENPLVQIADPTFLGHHIEGGYDATTKAFRRLSADEAARILVTSNGVTRVVNSCELAAEEDAGIATALRFNAVIAGIHCFSMQFLRRSREANLALPYRFAERITPYLDRRGRLVSPKKPNSVAFELEIGDALAWAERTLIIETRRGDEFSPPAGGTGDCAETARRALSDKYIECKGGFR
jgi:UDP-N-acetylglucosamine/UDP-N-acetylgalactosamine diphosphorylase